MANRLIARDTVHAWSEQIGEQIGDHQSSLQRLLKGQRRLTRYIETNNEHMGPGTAGVCLYMTGVIARMFDLAGGRLRQATWAQIRSAEAKIQGQMDALLPLDDDLLDRFHNLPHRAQAHILDEAAMALFVAERSEAEQDLPTVEAFKVLVVCWVVAEVLDANWRPASDFKGEETYAYVHIEPSANESDE
jgi:hypothetical protein